MTIATNSLIAVRRRHLGQLTEQEGAEPPPLVLVGDREGDLGALGVQPRIRAVSDDALVRPRRRDDPERLVVVDLAVSPGSFRQVHAPREEAERARLWGKRRQQIMEPTFIVRANRSDVDRRAVPQRDISFAVGRIRHAHRARLSISSRDARRYLAPDRGLEPLAVSWLQALPSISR